MPASYHIAQEIQKYNIPDYRPRQEQYALVFHYRFNVNCSPSPPTDSKRLSRRYARCSVCDETVALHSVRRRTPHGRTSRGSFGHTIRRKHTHGLLDIRPARGGLCCSLFCLVCCHLLLCSDILLVLLQSVMLFDGGCGCMDSMYFSLGLRNLDACLALCSKG